MKKDPYKVLGVDPRSTESEIKAAYRDLAKKYHPDNYVGSPLADLAEEKMQEINAAYDEIMKDRAKRREQAEDDRFGGQSRATSFPDVRRCIDEHDFYEADVLLNAVGQSERNAEWHYLKGIVFSARGWYFEASRHFATACEMDPENEEYAAARENLERTASGYGRGGRRDGECNVCDVCSSLICIDCCCEACGGDFIRCC